MVSYVNIKSLFRNKETFFLSILLILSLILITVTFRLLFEISYYDIQRIYFSGSLIAFLLYFLRSKKSYRVTKTHLIVISFLIIGLISSAINGIILIGATEVLHFGTILFVASIISAGCKKELILKFIYTFTLLFVVVYITYFFAGYASHLTNPFSPLWPASTTFKIEGLGGIVFSDTLLFSFIRFFNHVQTWTFPLLISLFIFKNESIHKLIIFILLSVWWALLIQSGGRGTFLAFSLSFFVVILLFKKNRKERFYIYTVSLLCGILLYLILFYSIADPFTAITREGTSGRIEMWHKAWLMFLSNPIFGTGPLSYSIVQNENLYFAHPHNFYLQILSEWGIIVFVMISALIMVGLYKKLIELKKNENIRSIELEIGVYASLIATFIHSGLSQNLHSPLSQIFLLFALSWFFFISETKNSLFQIKISKVSWVSLAIVMIFIILNAENIIELFAGNETYLDQFNTNRFYPRIWYQGLN